MAGGSSAFRRFVLPALAFKAVVIGGGYATGRELAEFFLPNGPQGGLLGILLAAAIWSLVCALTFLLARATDSADYRSFFQHLLGRFSPVFELCYFPFLALILAVFGAAAGAIGQSTFGWPPLLGSILLVVLIAAFTAKGNTAVERLFKYVSIFLYATYGLFLVLCLSRFGDRIVSAFAIPTPIGQGWALGGLTYAGYNIVGAVVILPVVRHLTSTRDAIIAGLICGPLAMLPAAIFFMCMTAYLPAIQHAALPSDMLLQNLHLPAFRLVFQIMIFAALLESGAGMVNAVNERVDRAWRERKGAGLPLGLRLAIAACLLIGSVFLAARIGLVSLIAKGYPILAWAFMAIYVLPLLAQAIWARFGKARS